MIKTTALCAAVITLLSICQAKEEYVVPDPIPIHPTSFVLYETEWVYEPKGSKELQSPVVKRNGKYTNTYRKYFEGKIMEEETNELENKVGASLLVKIISLVGIILGCNACVQYGNNQNSE